MNVRAVALLVLLGLAGASAQGAPAPGPAQGLVATIASTPELVELNAALSRTKLLKALSTFNGTVFAPNNEAMAAAVAAAGAALTPELLETIISYHLVSGITLKAADLTDGLELPNLAGKPLTVAFVDGNMTIKGVGSSAKVVEADLAVGASVVHIVDTVLLPIKLPEAPPAEEEPTAEAPTPAAVTPESASVVEAAEKSKLTFLVGAVKAAGLADTFGPDFVGTVFAPNDAAFTALLASPALAGVDIASPSADTVALLKSVLTYHVVADAVLTAADLQDGEEIVTMNGQSLTVAIEDGNVFLNFPSGRAQVLTADVLAGEAVVHVIDTVLFPTMEGAAPAPAPGADGPEGSVVDDPTIPAPPPNSAATNMVSLAVLAASMLAAALVL